MSAVCAAMQASFFVTYKRALLRVKNNQIVKFVIAVLFYVGNLSHSIPFTTVLSSYGNALILWQC